MSDRSISERGKAVVEAYYQAGVENRLTDFAVYFRPDLTVTAPTNYPGAAFTPAPPSSATKFSRRYPTLPDVLDFGRFSYDVFFVDGDRVVALIPLVGGWASTAALAAGRDASAAQSSLGLASAWRSKSDSP
jgi:hypothetical protein